MREIKLNKATIKDLDNKKPDLYYLIKNNLATFDSCNELFETLENECSIDIYEEACEYLGNQGYRIISEEYTIDDMVNDLFNSYMIKGKIKNLKENINSYTEEEQIKIFNKERARQRNLVEELLDILDTLDKDLVKEMMKEYDF